MMPSRPIYKYQPRSQCSLLPALRSERERKSKTVLSKWVALWPMCTTANDIYLFNLFCTLPTPLAPRQRQYSQCGRGGEVASQILAQVVLLLLPAGRKCHQSLCPTPPLPASSKGSRAKRQTTFSDCASGTPGGGGGVLPYMGYIGTCRGIGYGFLGSRSLNRVSFLTLLFLCPWCGP